MGGGGSKKAAPPQAAASRAPPEPPPLSPSSAAVEAEVNRQKQLNLLKPKRDVARTEMESHMAREATLKQMYDKARDEFAPNADILKAKRAYDAERAERQQAEERFNKLCTDINNIERQGQTMDDAVTIAQVAKIGAQNVAAMEKLTEAAQLALSQKKEEDRVAAQLAKANQKVADEAHKAEQEAHARMQAAAEKKAREEEAEIAAGMEERAREVEDEARRAALREAQRRRMEEARASAAAIVAGAGAPAAAHSAGMAQAPREELDVAAAKAAQGAKIACAISLPS